MAEENEDGELDIAKALAKYAPAPEQIDIKYSDKMKELCQELTIKVREAMQYKTKLKELNIRINAIAFGELPEMFAKMEIQTISVGNGIELRLEPYFKASLPVKMDPEKRAAGLDYIRERAPELIRTEVKLEFQAEEHASAEMAADYLRQVGLEPEVIEGIHHARLTSWVKEQFLAGKELALETLNAKIGSCVRFALVDETTQRALDKLKQMTKERDKSDHLPEGL